MPQIEFYLDDVEEKILNHITLNPEDWIENLVTWQARLAKDEICQAIISQMIADPTCPVIPSDHDQIVLNANLQTAAEALEEQMNQEQQNG